MAKKRRKKKRYISALFYWLLVVIAALCFLITFFTLPMFPKIWSLYLAGILLVIVGLLYLLSRANTKNRLVKLLNILVSAALLAVSIIFPKYTDQISTLFSEALGKSARISLYVMTDEYMAANPDIFDKPISSEELADYKNAVFITEYGLDQLNQVYAVKELKTELGVDSITSIDRQSVQDAVRSLYQFEGDVLIMAESYESIVMETEGFERFRSETRKIGSFSRPIDTSVQPSTAAITKETFSVFIGGNDEEGDLSLEGRTDVDMILTVNPNSHQIVMVNLPRDSYVPNPYWDNSRDKLTHLGLVGIDNTLAGVSQVLDESVDNYVLINFTTYQQIIDAIGGVDVDNPYAFGFWDNEDVWFEEGSIHLDGADALLYVRERYTLPDGDFGRNMHQQLVLRAIIDKLTSPEMILHFNDILDAMRGTFLTNLSSDSIYAFCQKQLDENIKWNIVNYRVLGESDYGACASAPGEWLSVVYIYPNQIEFLRDVLKEVHAGNIIEQQELPEGDFETDDGILDYSNE